MTPLTVGHHCTGQIHSTVTRHFPQLKEGREENGTQCHNWSETIRWQQNLDNIIPFVKKVGYILRGVVTDELSNVSRVTCPGSGDVTAHVRPRLTSRYCENFNFWTFNRAELLSTLEDLTWVRTSGEGVLLCPALLLTGLSAHFCSVATRHPHSLWFVCFC